MPTYEYECAACGHRFEEFQRISARPLKACPRCRKRKLRRLIGAGAAILFKGNGFYQTDYRSKEYKQKAQSESSKSKPSDSGDKTEGKKASAKSSTKTSSGSDQV